MSDESSNAADSPPPDQPWPLRKRRAEEVCEALCQSPGDTGAASGVAAFAADPKWEVRKVVAEGLASFPEDIYRALAPVLCGDTNALVAAAAERSMERRTPISGIATSAPGLIQNAIDRIESKHGWEASQAALRLAEKFTELHLRSAVHDIKNILTHFGLDIVAIAEVVRDPTTRSRLKRYEKGRQYLERLVEMMEAYSENLTLHFNTEDIGDIARESLASALDQVERQGRKVGPVECVLDVPDGMVASVSRFHFAMALTNLIKNAVEAHAISKTQLRNGQVLVRASVDAEWIVVTVSDKGRGIAAGDLMKLLEFIPGGSAKRRSGSGYGLPICRRYIEAHHGTFQMQSQEDGGTTATIKIPANNEQLTEP